MEEIFSAYNLSQNQLDVELFGNGLINKTWRIKNSHDDYILQKINHTVFKHPEAIAANVRMLADYLANAYPDFLFIRPIKTTTNEEIVHIHGKGYFRLCHYVRQSHTINAVEKKEQAYEAAKKFGQFTKLLSGFPIDKLRVTLPDFHNLSLRYQQFTEALENGNKERIQQSKELINFITKNKKIVETYEHILHNPAFKLRVTHHDTKISNVLFDKNDKGLCVIDLDTVMAGYFISDVGDMIRTYLSPVDEEEKDFSKIKIREEYFAAIWKGYMSEMSNELSTEEKNHFIYAGKFMIYMQAIRFLADYLNNDVYYGAKYKDQNFVRAGNQVMLLRRLMENEASLQRLIEGK
ncbi:aminoglycoside phosphotransferase family protein [Ginsengibacter hankyongi]|uniref:Aminoglycoside phosphotransferase family protein n=2 Tax=Ginsengibacter hankyongi TaxID=2607284 RepID=A0A5J5IDA2_9BACT|nr:aminoglycoside phosphotransferase family protein [Ginsengibacter hankyongi]